MRSLACPLVGSAANAHTAPARFKLKRFVHQRTGEQLCMDIWQVKRGGRKCLPLPTHEQSLTHLPAFCPPTLFFGGVGEDVQESSGKMGMILCHWLLLAHCLKWHIPDCAQQLSGRCMCMDLCTH